jgi:4-amino-4-deoxy-L-arabinose transferase-like glycosyltransferase
MHKLDQYFQSNPGKVFFFLLMLAIPAFFINLGLQLLFADEPTRANVALEMILSRNYAVPVIGSEYYYNKPPAYNWVLAFFYLLSGSYSEFVTRLPALIPLFLFAITIYYSTAFFLKDKRVAALSGILSLVYNRMITYDSMLGHIDIFYSWLTYISFMSIFYFYQKKQWFNLFLISYIITAVTFLMKGLPSIVFQGLTIATLLIYTKNLKKLFSWQHILSGIICLLIIGAYFYNYSLYNNNLPAYFSTLWNQSSQRTAVQSGIMETIEYMLLFPPDQLWQLFPASLLVLFCMDRNFIKEIKANPFLTYISLIFIINILVYWVSPQTIPRYIIMLYPLLLIIWSYAYYSYRNKLPRSLRIFNITIVVLCALVTLFIPAAFFAGLEKYVSALPIKVIIIFSGCAFLTWCMYKSPTQKIIYFLAFMLIIRLGFSWFVLPHRYEHGDSKYHKFLAEDAGIISKGQPFYFYQYHPEVLSLPLHDKFIFYIERTRMQPVKFIEYDTLPGYYFTFDRDLKNPDARLIRSYRGNLKLYKVQ